MARLTIRTSEWLRKDLNEYLLSLKGVKTADIDLENDLIDITFNEALINFFILKKENYLFLKTIIKKFQKINECFNYMCFTW